VEEKSNQEMPLVSDTHTPTHTHKRSPNKRNRKEVALHNGKLLENNPFQPNTTEKNCSPTFISQQRLREPRHPSYEPEMRCPNLTALVMLEKKNVGI
jgi:hypothetical protein